MLESLYASRLAILKLWGKPPMGGVGMCQGRRKLRAFGGWDEELCQSVLGLVQKVGIKGTTGALPPRLRLSSPHLETVELWLSALGWQQQQPRSKGVTGALGRL